MVGFFGAKVVLQQLTYHSYKVHDHDLEMAAITKQKMNARVSLKGVEPQSKVKTLKLAIPYHMVPKLGEVFGELVLPRLKVDLPIVEGTDADQLAKGVGHFQQSVLPGEKDNCVLSGHRDTVFRHLGELKIGDDVIVKTKAGTFVYRINKIRVVDASDRTVIVSTRLPMLTLTTCYPFHFIGNAPKRYIITAHLQPAESQVPVS